MWAEAFLVTVAGILSGTVAAWALSNMLVKVLRGVFDPAPASLSVPWHYLATVLAISLVATAAATTSALRRARTAPVELLRTQ